MSAPCATCRRSRDEHPVACFGCQTCQFRRDHAICVEYAAPLRLVLEHDKAAVFHGDSSRLGEVLGECTIDAIVTDPPAAISFMGREWDSDKGGFDGWTKWLAELLKPALRALKPGGYCLLWALPRTSHWTARALELAGFEVRDVHHDALPASELAESFVDSLSTEQVGALARLAECGEAPSIFYQIFGSGFPKSLNISKAVDAINVIGPRRERALKFTAWIRSTGITASRINAITGTSMGSHYVTDKEQPEIAVADMFDKLRPHLPPVPEEIEAVVRSRTVESENLKRREVVSTDHRKATGRIEQGTGGYAFGEDDRTMAYSAAAAAASGVGTALKPSIEHWILARKPLDDTYAANWLKHGTGGLNIDACRIGTDDKLAIGAGMLGYHGADGSNPGAQNVLGRWPAHFSLRHAADCEFLGESPDKRQVYENAGARDGDESTNFTMVPQTAVATVSTTREVYRCAPGCPVAELDAQSGAKTGTHGIRAGQPRGENAVFGKAPKSPAVERTVPADAKGGASRFFYCAKGSRSEKDAGLAHLAPRTGGEATDREDGSAGVDNPRAGAGRTGGARNFHPTVKSIALMRWLVRLVTPPGGIVLDMFAGSGSTGVAALAEGRAFVGCELTEEYLPILVGRISHALGIPPPSGA